jgi:outer membrane receptor for ferrienterochelin and colicin
MGPTTLRFNLQTANDIALVVPGFALEEMTQARGLLASAGNVLVDGQRPTAKSGGLQEVLSRIPAASVLRVEVSRGAPASAEAAGQTLVVNTVRAQAVSSGTWLVQVKRPTEPVLNGRAEGALIRRIGDRGDK